MDFKIEDLIAHPPKTARRDYRIGVIGAGFVIREVQLVAYRKAGYHIAAIASRTPETAQEVAGIHGVARVYDTIQELLDDQNIEVLDIAVPPDQQIHVIREAVRRADHLKGILAHKPLAMNYSEAHEMVQLCADAGIKLAVNQNMRYDPSITALKKLLNSGELGTPVLATIEMRAVPHWQSWLRKYDRLTLLNMSIHHLDCFRYWFGSPETVYASARTDPRTRFRHSDGICLYTLEYADGLRAAAWDDIWAGPADDNEALGAYVKWRVEGTEGLAEGTVGWPAFPNHCPSTLRFTSVHNGGNWVMPQWKQVWFPDAFALTMGCLLDSLARGTEPEISGRDNLDTMALVDASYLSIREHRPVRIAEIRNGSTESGKD